MRVVGNADKPHFAHGRFLQNERHPRRGSFVQQLADPARERGYVMHEREDRLGGS
jgi:hypothetical protein